MKNILIPFVFGIVTLSAQSWASGAGKPRPQVESDLDRALKGRATRVAPVTVEGLHVWIADEDPQAVADRVCRLANFERATAYKTFDYANPNNTEHAKYYTDVVVIDDELRVRKTRGKEGGMFDHSSTVFEYVYCEPAAEAPLQTR